MGQSILRDEKDDDEDEENEVPDDDIVNQMISRSEEEFELFQRMDIERRRLEAEAGADRKPRLLEEEEEEEEEEQDDIEDDEDLEEVTRAQQEEEMGRGNRSRKEVTYHEQLSEKDWLKAIGAEEEDSDDAPPGFQEDSPKKKKKKRTREENEEEPRRKKKKADRRFMKKMKKLLEVVMQYEDRDGRILSEPFYKLPSRKELPDYYEIIRRPVNIAKIQQRIDDDKYEDMDGLEKDFMLMCKNTQQYNEDGSLINEDSIVLQSVFTNAREKLMGELANESVAGSTASGPVDEDAPVTPKKGRKPRKDKGEPKSAGRKGRKKKIVVSDDDEDDED